MTSVDIDRSNTTGAKGPRQRASLGACHHAPRTLILEQPQWAPNVVSFGCEGHKMLPAKRPTWLTLTAAFVALGLVSAEGVAAKCGAPLEVPGLARNSAVIVVDGSVVAAGMMEDQAVQAAFGSLGPDDIFSIEILCWNPRTGTFGGGPAIGVWVIWTKASLRLTRTPLEELLGAQDAYFAAHSRYATSLDALADLGGPDTLLKFSATSDGWSAATSGEDAVYRCAVYSGNAPPEFAGMTAGEVACEEDDTRASRAMREWYKAATAS